jgi:hypothetical protein
MTRLNPAFTSLKTLNITYQTPQETLLGTPETLPTSEPATPQIRYTVAESDLPTFNMPPYQKKWVAIVIGAGKAVTAATIYYRMKKNGASIASGSSSVSANYFYTRQCCFYDVAVGDVLELALWSDQVDSYWDYKAYQIQVSRVILFDKPRLLSPCKFAALTTHPALTLGSPGYAIGNLYPCFHDDLLTAISSPTSYDFFYPKDTYGMFRLTYGDYSYPNGSINKTSTTYRPYYSRNYVPTQIIMRGVKTG